MIATFKVGHKYKLLSDSPHPFHFGKKGDIIKCIQCSHNVATFLIGEDIYQICTMDYEPYKANKHSIYHNIISALTPKGNMCGI